MEDVEKDKIFPEGFLWGAGESEYQVSGASYCPDSQWAQWEKRDGVEASGTGVEGAKYFLEDADRMKGIGLNAFRFSIEWSLIEPKEGMFNKEAIKHYQDEISALLTRGITPMVTLHHFTNPMWFENMGAFEKEENLKYIVRFTKRMFSEFGKDVKYWCTINEPGIYSFTGYLIKLFPPGKCSPRKMGEVVKNLLKSHCLMYEAIKEMEGSEETQVGIVHQEMRFTPYRKYNLLERFITKYLTYAVTASITDFFKTGKFSQWVSPFYKVTFEEKEIKNKCDFFGLNYYGHPVIGQQMSLKEPFVAKCSDEARRTDFGFCTCASGFKKMLIECSKLGYPIFVTENGIADSGDDKREQFILEHLQALKEAISEGVDVRGYFYWSLLDNYEWAEGWKMKFGLYYVDRETNERTLKNGAQPLIDMIKTSKKGPQ